MSVYECPHHFDCDGRRCDPTYTEPSVLDAARADWGERELRWLKLYGFVPTCDFLPAMVSRGMAEADREVAAAVLAVQADNNRRIEALEVELQRARDERQKYVTTLLRERDAAERKVHAVEVVQCWTNEDGKRFMFVDEVAAALEIPGARAALASAEPGGAE